jgi:kynurenine 3-monooxygenase
MVPFFGQGMNCGFEDVLILDEIFSKYVKKSVPTSTQLESILHEYTNYRQPDAEAICDLALQNYITMRSEVVDPQYLMRKRLENLLYRFFPSKVMPLYSMVSFSRIRYSTAKMIYKVRKTQFTWLMRLSKVGFIASIAILAFKIPKLREMIQGLV